MLLLDPTAIPCAAAAVLCACVATVTWRRRAHSPTIAAALALAMLAGCWWSLAVATTALTEQKAAAIAWLATTPGSSTMVAAFVLLGLAIARPTWVPPRGVVIALLIEPVGITLAAATNPWHLLVYRGAGAAQLTQPFGWTNGPVFWLAMWYSYLGTSVSVGLLAWGWWRAAPAFRAQRLALLLSPLVPLMVNMVRTSGVLSSRVDPTPLGFAVTGTLVFYVVFRRDLFTFSPVARALIVDQLGDAVVVISPGGRFLDLNPAAIALVRGMDPDAPAKLIGAPAGDRFDDALATRDGRQTDVVVKLPCGRTEFHVQASPLVDRHHRDLGRVFVARDVTEANALTRRLTAAHTQLVAQVQTIDVLRADLVEQASRDPLTGLHNRRHLVERFAALLAATQKTGDTLAVVLVDVDKFKSINDRYGHLAGDAVLVSLAQRMATRAPPGALVARWGGEEFFVVLPGADAAAGIAFADDLRRRCEQSPTVEAGQTIGATISGGVATCPASGTTMDDLFHAADVAMYQAKDAGRNLVRLAAGPVPVLRTPGMRT